MKERYRVYPSVYRKFAKRKVEKEYQKFKKNVIFHKCKEEIWELCTKIQFYTCIEEYFALNSRIPEEYLLLAMAEPKVIEKAWKKYLRDDSLSYSTWGEIDELFSCLLMSWKMPKAG